MKLIYQNLRLYFFSGCKFKQIIVNHNTLYVFFFENLFNLQNNCIDISISFKSYYIWED